MDMSLLQYLRDERYKLVSGALVTGIGFLLALFVNGKVEDLKSQGKRDSMLQAIKYEASSNEKILRNSFMPMYRGGIVFRQLNTSVISQALTNPEFIEYSNAQSIEITEQYFRAISLGNSYRDKVEKIRFSDEYLSKRRERTREQADGIETLLTSLLDAWEKNIGECQESISNLQAIK